MIPWRRIDLLQTAGAYEGERLTRRAPRWVAEMYQIRSGKGVPFTIVTGGQRVPERTREVTPDRIDWDGFAPDAT